MPGGDVGYLSWAKFCCRLPVSRALHVLPSPIESDLGLS